MTSLVESSVALVNLALANTLPACLTRRLKKLIAVES